MIFTSVSEEKSKVNLSLVGLFIAHPFDEVQENQTQQKAKISEIKEKLETVEENHAIGKIVTEVYNKYTTKYTRELKDIEKEIQKISFGSSNLSKCLNFVVDFCSKPSKWWENANIGERTIIQNILFPNEIIYERENDRVRTNRINSLFSLIPELIRGLKGNKKGETTSYDNFSFLVTSSGFKPETS